MDYTISESRVVSLFLLVCLNALDLAITPSTHLDGTKYFALDVQVHQTWTILTFHHWKGEDSCEGTLFDKLNKPSDMNIKTIASGPVAPVLAGSLFSYSGFRKDQNTLIEKSVHNIL